MAKATSSPIILVVGGPNGAGKSTAAATVFGEEARANEFLNADVIARGLAAFEPERAAFAAGRVMLTRIKQLVAARSSFAFESTLSSRTFAPLLQSAKADGYRVHLLYVWVPSAELSLKRVAHRAAGGGHDIPEADVRRRFGRSAANFFELYRPIADRWMVYDNSAKDAVLVTDGGIARRERIAQPVIWRKMQEIARAQKEE
jgi:predicted ABC-type ATPase